MYMYHKIQFSNGLVDFIRELYLEWPC